MVAAQLFVPAPDLVRSAETPIPNAPCAHESRQDLGADRTAHFYRCKGCGAVLVAQRDHLWILRAAGTP